MPFSFMRVFLYRQMSKQKFHHCMQSISVFQHNRAIQKIEALCQVLECAGLSTEELIQKRNELQELFEAHHQLKAELNKREEDYYRYSKIVRQNYRILRNKLKIERV